MLNDLSFFVAGTYTKRFHTQPTIHNETVGHHTALVCGLLSLLYPECRKEVLVHALYHDIAEAITGDIPSPSKRAGYVDRSALALAEHQLTLQHGINVPQLTGEEHHILKVCDILSGMITCAHEIKMGNTHMRVALSNFASYFEEMDCTNERAIAYWRELKNC